MSYAFHHRCESVAYALTALANEKEYFAEISEAYWGTTISFPSTEMS